MAHLSSSHHTLTISLCNGQITPATDGTTVTQTFAIQGPTTVYFNLSSDAGSSGIYEYNLDFGDGTPAQSIYPRMTNNIPDDFTSRLTPHTYYQTTSSANELTATATALYFAKDGNTKPLSAVHKVILKQSAENMVEKNLEILNNQLFTIAGSATPMFNLESDDNIVFPCVYTEEAREPIGFDDNIYLNTDPETGINLSETYLYQTRITFDTDNIVGGTDALSGSSFTLQGKTGALFTVALAVSGEPLKFDSSIYTGSTVLSTNMISAADLSTNTLIDAITGLFSFRNLIGPEFSNITRNSTSIFFFQSNQLPPEATIRTFTTETSATSTFNGVPAANSFSPYTATDFTYSYSVNAHGPTGITGLSSINRIKTNPNELFITAL